MYNRSEIILPFTCTPMREQNLLYDTNTAYSIKLLSSWASHLQRKLREDGVVQDGLPASLNFRQSEVAAELDSAMNCRKIICLEWRMSAHG